VALVGKDFVNVGTDVGAVDFGVGVVEVCEGSNGLGDVQLCHVPTKASNNTTDQGCSFSGSKRHV